MPAQCLDDMIGLLYAPPVDPVRPASGLLYERFYREVPSRVFAVLVGRLALEGQVQSIERYGRQVTFMTSRCSTQQVCTLRGWVDAWCGGTLLQVQATGREVLSEEQDDREVTRLMALLGEVGDKLQAEAAYDGAGARLPEPDR